MTLSTTHTRSLILLILASSMALVLLCLTVQGDASGPIAPDECCRCHFEICDETQSQRYVHSPVADSNCAICHIQQSNLDQQESTSANNDKIDWFNKEYTLATEHWFELPDRSQGLPLSLQARTAQNKEVFQEITIPLIEEIAPFPAQQGQIQISELNVDEVKQGVFISAHVTWRTDQITNSKLRYSHNNTPSATGADPRWTTEHALTITGLEKEKTYRLAVVAEDIFGNETISPATTFSTQHFFSSAPPQPAAPNTDIAITPQFFKEKERIFVSFSINQQVSMKLGFRDGITVREQGENATVPSQHLPLTDPYDLSLTVCLTCHPDSKGELSHPVDILPSKGMSIPADYTTLADGRLTCMTCHTPHSGNDHYRLIRENRKDLCLGCHKNF